MFWHLNDDVSYCKLNDRLYFLDIQNDRYFQLSRSLEDDFLSYLENPDNNKIRSSKLEKLNLLPQILTETGKEPNLSITPPLKSVFEESMMEGDINFNIIRDVFFIVTTMYWQLKTRRLKAILRTLTQYRRRLTSPSADSEAGVQLSLVEETAMAFNRVRPYIPIETCCLIDSLSMTRFMAKRGLHVQLVLGITCDPFSAHAWVQRGPMVLNDTIGNALAHVPIRVI